jgi:hypothetical protein
VFPRVRRVRILDLVHESQLHAIGTRRGR